MINVLNLARQYAEETGGQFTDYDHTKAVMVVPLPGGRFQTILAISRTGSTSGKELAIFSSKVCELDSSINLRELLEENLNFDYCKFIIEDNFVKVEASCVSSSANVEQVKEMIMEVASVADQMELKFTGLDVH
jgi:hypothetical protein